MHINQSCLLPNIITDELFDIRYKPSDIVIDHLCDELDRYGFITNNHENFDHAVIFYFSNISALIKGELRVDRVLKIFTISATINDVTIMPLHGEWCVIVEYLQKLLG